MNMLQDQIPANIADTLQDIATKFDVEQQEMANFIQTNINISRTLWNRAEKKLLH